jgi:hypothetical protein
MAKMFLDFGNYPQLKNSTSGQRLTVTLGGVVQMGRDGITLEIDGIKVGKKGKMSTQDTLMANRLDRIEQKLPGQAVAM